MNKFKEWVLEHRYTAAQIAEAVGCSRKSVYAYMQGYRSPNKATMKAMEKTLGIDVKKIFLED